MKNECSIVCDLLPLYAEDMVSEDTAEFVKEHLGNCPTCRAELEKAAKACSAGSCAARAGYRCRAAETPKKSAADGEGTSYSMHGGGTVGTDAVGALLSNRAGILRLFAGTGYGNRGSKRRSNYLFQQ